MAEYEVDRDEVLRYLGYRGQSINEEIDVLIDQCRNEILEISKPRYICEYFNIEKDKNKIQVLNTTFNLEGNSIIQHLIKSESIAILAVTLGNEVDKKLALQEKIDVTKTIILDSCASVLIEEVCDEVTELIRVRSQAEGKEITSRFSPGYGDLNLSIQKKLLEVIDAQRRIGLTATSSYLLLPRKSVTAIVGIGKDIKSQNNKVKCNNCNNRDNCVFKREDELCGYKK